MAPSQSVPVPEPKSSQTFLHELNEEILSAWEARVRGEVSSAARLLRPALRNSLSRFLDLLSEALTEDKARGMQEVAQGLVQEHGRDRARTTSYGPNQIVQELQALREIVTSTLEQRLQVSPKEYATIQKTFDQAIQEALMEYFLMHAKLREQFVATLTHDLRGPLATARMGAELTQRVAASLHDREQAAEISGFQDRIVMTLKRADRMIQELLDASILRVGEQIPIHLQDCDLLSVIREALDDFGDGEKPRVRIKGATVQGRWDPDGLRRSVGNLISNALKYGAKGRPVTVELRHSADRAEVSVHNEGNPISEEDQKNLFLSFHRGREAIESGQKGWGIGLALVKAVTESLGGGIHVESSLESGTTFTMDLPLDASPFAKSPGLLAS